MNHYINRLGSAFLSASCKGFLFSILPCTYLSVCSLAQAADSVAEQPAPIEVVDSQQFEYQPNGRLDPFIPFIAENASVLNANVNEFVDSDTPLTGMQVFEPGQLALVALLKQGNKHIAMVEDFSGKGYVLTKGTKIGRRGIVKDITNNVIIEETAVTRTGKKIITEIVMILKKEGEE